MRGVITANWTIFSHYDSPKRFALLWCGNLGGVVSNRFLFLPRSLGKWFNLTCVFHVGLFNHLGICRFSLEATLSLADAEDFLRQNQWAKKWCLEAESQRRKVLGGSSRRCKWLMTFFDCKSPISRVNLLPKWLKWLINGVDPNHLLGWSSKSPRKLRASLPPEKEAAYPPWN